MRAALGWLLQVVGLLVFLAPLTAGAVSVGVALGGGEPVSRPLIAAALALATVGWSAFAVGKHLVGR